MLALVLCFCSEPQPAPLLVYDILEVGTDGSLMRVMDGGGTKLNDEEKEEEERMRDEMKEL